MSYEALSRAVTATFVVGCLALITVILLAVFDPGVFEQSTTVTVRAHLPCTH